MTRTHTHARRHLRSDQVVRLVDGAAAGDRDAWDMLVDTFGGLVWATTRAYRLGDADAADVAQTTWMRLVQHLDQLEDPARVGGWIATTARRECLAMLRRSGRTIPASDRLPDVPDDGPAPHERLEHEERSAAVRRALGQLGPRDRALLSMLTLDPPPSYEAIGAALGLAVGSIGPTRARALARLRELLRCSGMVELAGTA